MRRLARIQIHRNDEAVENSIRPIFRLRVSESDGPARTPGAFGKGHVESDFLVGAVTVLANKSRVRNIQNSRAPANRHRLKADCFGRVHVDLDFRARIAEMLQVR